MTDTSKTPRQSPTTRPANEDSTLPYPVPVVRLVVPDPGGCVLILRRQGGGYAAGQWCLPGGKVDYGDTVEQTVAKELVEETGLRCTSAEFLFFQDSLPVIPGKMHCINLYFCCAAEGEIVLNPESTEYAWISPAELDDHALAFRNDEGLKRYWLQGRVSGRKKMCLPVAGVQPMGTAGC